MDNSHSPPDSPLMHVPTEICEHIIDALYSDAVQAECNAALSQCALVCRAWRIRSQRWILHHVLLSDTPAVQKFSAILDSGPHLRDYVHEVTLAGDELITTSSPLSPFAIALYRKLPQIQVIHVTVDHAAVRPPPALGQNLTYIALHPHFPLFFAFTTVTRLALSNLAFPRFSDFAKMVNSLPALQDLSCQWVRWLIVGPLPSCMQLRSDGKRGIPQHFAPELCKLSTVRTL